MTPAGVLVLVCGLFLSSGGVSAQLQTATACVGEADAGSCALTSLQCDFGQKIFVIAALTGLKVPSSSCPSDVTDCDDSSASCCQPQDGDCVQLYSQQDFTEAFLTSDCGTQQTCSVRPSRTDMQCGYWPARNSTYATVNYACLTDSQILDFNVNASVTAPVVALRYQPSLDTDRPPGIKRTWFALVESGSYRESVEVTQILSVTTCDDDDDDDDFDDSCRTSYNYLVGSYRAALLSLQVPYISSSVTATILAVVYSRTGVPMKVTSGYALDQACNDCTTTKFPVTTDSPVATDSSEDPDDVDPVDNTTPYPTDSTPFTMAPIVIQPGDPRSPQDALSGMNLAAIIGGSVAAALVLIVIIIVLAAVCSRRYRAPQPSRLQEETSSEVGVPYYKNPPLVAKGTKGTLPQPVPRPPPQTDVNYLTYMAALQPTQEEGTLASRHSDLSGVPRDLSGVEERAYPQANIYVDSTGTALA